MSLQTSRLLARTRKKSEEEAREEEGGEGGLDSRLLSLCPSCRCEYDIALLLPCSHTLCGRCIRKGEEAGACQAACDAHGARRGASPPACAVMCPCCCHPVELPCWEWASALSCLPQDPTLSPWRDAIGRGIDKGAVKAQLDMLCLDPGDVTAKGSLHDSGFFPSPHDGVIDLQEEDMRQSVVGLSFVLDPSTADPSLRLSNSSLIVTFKGSTAPVVPCHRTGNWFEGSKMELSLPQVRADVLIAKGQFYWEVDVCNSTLYRIGVTSLDISRSWWMERRGVSFSTVYDGYREPVRAVPPHIKTLGVFLNMGGGALSFHNPLTQEHLATLPTRFSPTGVTPALGLGAGRLKIHSGLPPPPHIFLCRGSTYRGPSGAGGGRWRRDVNFQSVRTVIQKFEELVGSDSDSGLVSGFGSSCSTLASFPDPGGPGTSLCLGPGSAHISRKGQQEPGAE